jgi:N-methylhydantoinase A/oxoprolinase/acetone carboxylase beta subunit
MRIETRVDVRYAGQSYEISVPLTPAYRSAFDRRHGQLYGYASPDRPTEVVALRVVAAGVTDKPALPRARAIKTRPARPVARRPGRFDGRVTPVAFFRWPDLEPGARGRGPAVITGAEATVVVPPRSVFRVDVFGNVLVTPS